MKRTNRLLCSAVAFAMPIAVLAGNYRFTSTGPTPGRISQLIAHPTRPGELYAREWVMGRMQKSLDGGQTWSTLGESNEDRGVSITFHPFDPDTFYVAAGQSVLITRDSGRTFERKSTGPGSFSPLRVEVSADGTVLYAVSVSVRRSVDGGETWSDSYESGSWAASSLAPHPSNGSIAYLLNAEGGLRITTNAGQTWSPFGSGLPPAQLFEFATLSSSRLNPQVLLAGYSAQGVFRSTDGGTTWAPAPFTPFLTTEISADPVVAGRFLAVGSPEADPGLAISQDDGKTWDRIEPLTMHEVHAAAFDPTADGGLYAAVNVQIGTDDLFRTDDLGEIWSVLATSGLSGGLVSSVATHPIRPVVAYAASSRGVHRTRDRAQTWQLLSDLTGVQRLLIDRQDPRRLWATVGQEVQRSIDGGFAWAGASAGLPAETAVEIEQAPSLPDTLYVGVASGVFKSENGGDSWVPTGPLPTGAFPRAVAVDSSDPNIVYAGAGGGSAPTLYRSENGGAAWNPVPEVLGPVMDVQVDAAEPSVVYALTTSRVWQSTNRGLSFSELTPWAAGDPDELVGLALHLNPSRPSELFLQDEVGGVFRSPDRGQTWHLLPNAPFNRNTYAVYDFEVSVDGRTLFQATPYGLYSFDRGWDDVPDADPFFPSTDLVALHGVTAGCGGGNFCPSNPITRAQSSVFLLRSLEGSPYEPPPATGSVFFDVPANAFAAAWIEELFDRGITAGCGPGLFCPDLQVSRAQAAVLNLRTKNGNSYQPPPPTGTLFADVPVSHFATAWIEEFAREGYTAGCAPNLFCPEQAVTRGQMAVFLASVFSLL